MNEPTPFEKRSREVLEESSARLDGHTRSRLTQARHAALEELRRPERHWWRGYVPAGAAAAVAVLAVVVWSGRMPESPPESAQTAGAIEDLDLLVDAEGPDFSEESADLEFYEWAAGEVES